MKHINNFNLNPRVLRFESTYKELKLYHGVTLSKIFRRFESTYKELKLGVVVLAVEYCYRFESTYKELKLVADGRTANEAGLF